MSVLSLSVSLSLSLSLYVPPGLRLKTPHSVHKMYLQLSIFILTENSFSSYGPISRLVSVCYGLKLYICIMRVASNSCEQFRSYRLFSQYFEFTLSLSLRHCAPPMFMSTRLYYKDKRSKPGNLEISKAFSDTGGKGLPYNINVISLYFSL